MTTEDRARSHHPDTDPDTGPDTNPGVARAVDGPSPPALASLRSPADLVVAVPYLLGFEPRNSLVVVAFGDPAPGRTAQCVSLTARVDLPPRTMSTSAAMESLGGVFHAVARVGASSVGLVVHPHPQARALPPLPHAALVRRLTDRWRRHGVDVLDALCVRRGSTATRYWSYLCTEPCCPPTGTRLAPGDGMAVRAAFVVSGASVADDRRAVRARLDPRPRRDPLVRAVLAELHRRTADRPRPLVLAQWRRIAARRACAAVLGAAREVPAAPLTALQVADVTVACADVQVRDIVLAELSRHPHLPVVDVLVEALRLVPQEFRAALAGTIAAGAYLGGDGALAWDAIDLCLGIEPEHRLAHLIGTSLRHGLPPQGLADIITREAPRPETWDGTPRWTGDASVPGGAGAPTADRS